MDGGLISYFSMESLQKIGRRESDSAIKQAHPSQSLSSSSCISGLRLKGLNASVFFFFFDVSGQ